MFGIKTGHSPKIKHQQHAQDFYFIIIRYEKISQIMKNAHFGTMDFKMLFCDRKQPIDCYG